MKILDMLPELDAKALATVHANATRLVSTGSRVQRDQAATALPLIEAEQERRAALAPVKAKSTKAKSSKPKASKATAKASASVTDDAESEPAER